MLNCISWSVRKKTSTQISKTEERCICSKHFFCSKMHKKTVSRFIYVFLFLLFTLNLKFDIVYHLEYTLANSHKALK